MNSYGVNQRPSYEPHQNEIYKLSYELRRVIVSVRIPLSSLDKWSLYYLSLDCYHASMLSLSLGHMAFVCVIFY
jgi:hypothetical protein